MPAPHLKFQEEERRKQVFEVMLGRVLVRKAQRTGRGPAQKPGGDDGHGQAPSSAPGARRAINAIEKPS